MTFRAAGCKLALEGQECQQSAAPSASGGNHGHQQPQKENTCRGHRGIHPHGRTGRLKGHRRERGSRLFLGHDPHGTRGERVLSRREAAGYGEAGASTVNVTINARDAESFRQSRTQVASDIARAVSLGRRGM